MDEYKRVNCDFYDQLEDYATKGKKLLLMVMDDVSVSEIEGKIKTFATQNQIEFLILESGEHIRLDNIMSVTEF